MQIESSEVWLLVGASRGLGFEFFKQLQNLPVRPQQLLLISRNRCAEPAHQEDTPSESWFSVDLSKPESLEHFLELASAFKINRFVYFAGGGPYGPYATKNWKDHEWAFKVSFIAAARLFHHFMRSPDFRQGIAIGSQIAERSPDIGAASYCAAKHALFGLLSTLQQEAVENRGKAKGLISQDLRLFSPGYMNTELLPASSWPRAKGLKILEPTLVASELLGWMQNSHSFCQNWPKADL
jgi:short-subunit dehydrogenase